MAQSTRQTNLLVEQDWTKVYQSFTNADFTSYDFETLRNSMINYLKTYYPETFNDFLESSEYLALIDMIAFLGQSLAFRTDLNARENFLDTAQRRDSILKLARMLSYNPTRTNSATGLLKFDSVSTSEELTDSNGTPLANATIFWNDTTNDNWQEQFNTILNAAMVNNQVIGKPGNSQILNGVTTEEYSINYNNLRNTLPVVRFTTNIQNNSVTFEAVSATTVGETYIYETDPTTRGKFNILYRNDNNGNGSNNTGFFLYFKQGSLQATTFAIQNAIPNNFITVGTNNINETDAWLYALDVDGNPATLWNKVPSLPGTNVIYNQLSDKNLYQLNTLNNDQVNIVFGDGSFSNVPQGSFTFYYRTTTGQSYTITPDNMSSVTLAISYTSASGSTETLTVTASLKYTVTDASAAQSLTDIKTYAPQQYYTQNRMITGEDYNIFPLTTFSTIQKIKAVNRTSSGISAYLDTVDPTGSFSSTNIFGDDGVLTANAANKSITFDFITINDIYTTIFNTIIPVVSSTEMINYYYANSTRYNSPYANVTFVQSANSTVSSTGNLTYNNSRLQIGANVSGNLQYVTVGSTLQFSAPAGFHFDAQNNLLSGAPSLPGDTLTFFAAVTNIVAGTDIYTPYQLSFGTVVPTGAILSDTGLTGNVAIIPTYVNNFSANLVSTIVNQISTKVNFGLTYSQSGRQWINVPGAPVSTNLLQFSFVGGLYNVEYKTLTYSFGSSNSTVFYFDPAARVYDSSTGSIINDSISVLKINSQPGNNNPLANDVNFQIYDVVTAADGYVDNSVVLVKSPSTQMEDVPDNPDLYKTVANTAVSRSSLYFKYKHNVPSRTRIDPTPINIIDLYILTADYASSYLNWLKDLTGKIVEPAAPTSTSLEVSYSTLNEYKAISDSLIYNPAQFKPLFGSKANTSVQARFQVVKNAAISITDNEIKSQVIAAINTYFDINNWDFGDTFYFSELAAYLHSSLAPNISSVVIVPANSQLPFGNYFQVNAEPWEIITSAATVNDVDIITAVTAAQLNLGTPLVGTF
jgi:hypothetical protein